MQESVDLEAYVTRYHGHGLVTRLLCIAKVHKPTRLEALQAAFRYVRESTVDTRLYLEIADKIRAVLEEEQQQQQPTNSGAEQQNQTMLEVDEAWVREVEANARMNHDRLESELNSHKTSQIKESIRMGYNDFGDFFYSSGRLEDALRSFIKTRDYCSTSAHIVQMCTNVVKVATEMQELDAVENYVLRAEMSISATAEPAVHAKLHACMGIAMLGRKQYRQAALRFSECSIGTGEDGIAAMAAQFGDLLALEDIALYGGLLALATFSRDEVRDKVLSNSAPLRSLLELVPDVREAIADFHASHYTATLAFLTKIRPEVELDLYMRAHIEPVFQMVRATALVQYATPYDTVDLNRMALAFDTQPAALQAELAAAIMSGAISARIDTHRNVLQRSKTETRDRAIHDALVQGQASLDDMQANLMRLSMTRDKIIFTAPRMRATDAEVMAAAGGASSPPTDVFSPLEF